jgi:hypothetical protein
VRTIGLVLAALLAAVGSAHGQGTFPLTFEAFPDDKPLGSPGERWYWKAEELPEGLKAANESLTEEVFHYLADVGEKKLLVAIQRKPLTLVVDTDFDNDLSDETAIKGPETDSAWRRFCKVTVGGGDSGMRANSLLFGCFWEHKGDPIWLTVAPGGIYTGEITLDGETYSVCLTDTTLDGEPNDRLQSDPEASADTLGIDYKRDKHYDGWDELTPLPVQMIHGQSLYEVSAAADGSSITFAKSTAPMGTVRILAPGGIVRLDMMPGAYRVAMNGAPSPLPVGEYRVRGIQLCTWDDKGFRYRMQCLSRPEEVNHLQIKEGETTTIEVGPPLTVKADPVRDGENIVVNVQVWGAHGERYFPYGITDGGHLEGPAGIKIFDEAGKELASGGFEYG